MRLSSIRSAILLCAPTDTTTSVNGWGDSLDVTQFKGTYSLNIGGLLHPQSQLNSSLSPAGIYTALRGAIGNVYRNSNSMSISSLEFLRGGKDVSTLRDPSKFYVGVNLNRVRSDALLTGISSSSSPISVIINSPLPTLQSYNCSLILLNDCLIELDIPNRQMSSKM
jgi:hypothetical protein